MHQGNAIIQLATKYPTLLTVIYEQVQNALDKKADHISVLVDFGSRKIITFDNGEGTGVGEFNKALLSIGQSIKALGSMGRFGLGLISPLGKCASYDFTSCSASRNNSYKTWSFVTADIKKQKRNITIPLVERKDLRFGRKKKNVRKSGGFVWWRTQIHIKKFTKDKLLSNINMISLIEGITDRFSDPMRKLNTSIDIKIVSANKSVEEKKGIKAKRFTGKKIPIVVIKNKDGGETTFELFLSPKTTDGYKGRLRFGEKGDQYRFSLSGFTRSAAGILPDNVVAVLRSGFFEGGIFSEKACLTASRKSFAVNDAFMGFCCAIEEWFNDYGSDYVKQYTEKSLDKRYQDLGIKSLKTIEKLLKDKVYGRNLESVLKHFKNGTIGEGHYLDPDKDDPSSEKKKKKATRGGAGKKRAAVGAKVGGNKGPRKLPVKKLKDHNPFVVSGPGGKNRRLIKSDSLGVQLSHEAMPNSDNLWDIDYATGTIYFNIRHPLWVKCDKDDRTLLRLQEYITIQALCLCDQPPEWRERFRLLSDDNLRLFVFLLTQSSSFATQAQLNKLKVVT